MQALLRLASRRLVGASRSSSSSSTIYPNAPRVGVGVVVFRKSVREELQVLLIKRGKEPGKGQWSFPGGSLELGETMVACAVREVAEETGIHLRTQLQQEGPARAVLGGELGTGAAGGVQGQQGQQQPQQRQQLSYWSSSLAHPTAFAAADSITPDGDDASRIKYHYAIVEVAALAADPLQEPVPGDDAADAMWCDVARVAKLQGLTSGCSELTHAAVRVFGLPHALGMQEPAAA